MSNRDQTNATCTLEKVRAAKAEALGVFEQLAHVAGIGITRIGRGYGLKINVRNAPAANLALPTEINGVPVTIEVVGAVRKRAA